MDIVPLIAAVAVLVAVVGSGVVRSRWAGRRSPVKEVTVTLSVLPTGTALVVLDVDGDGFRPAVDHLVEHAVREAFLFSAVDVVEVRRRDSALIERRHRVDGASRTGGPARAGLLGRPRGR